MSSKTKVHDAKKICGAKTRAGTPCQQVAGWGTNHVGEGRCKLHGGKSTGPKDRTKAAESKKGNKNAVTTGEHEGIWFDILDEEEKELYFKVELDNIKALKNEIRLLEIRERRMLKRVKELKQDEMVVLEDETKEPMLDGSPEMEIGSKRILKTNSQVLITNIEEALTRIQNAKHRMISEKNRIEESLGKGNEYEDLSSIAAAIYGDVDEK